MGLVATKPAFRVSNKGAFKPFPSARERSGSVVECLTGDRRAAGFSLTGVTALWSLSKTQFA